jgi:hypothetical protein
VNAKKDNLVRTISRVIYEKRVESRKIWSAMTMATLAVICFHLFHLTNKYIQANSFYNRQQK